MILTDAHIEAIKKAALPVEYGSIKICFGTDESIDIIVEKRIRLPKETAQTPARRVLLANPHTARPQVTQRSPCITQPQPYLRAYGLADISPSPL